MRTRVAAVVLAAAVAGTGAAPTPTTATIHLCGDSTMANLGGPASPTQGWGEFLHYSFDAARYAVSNAAIAGRSARSYTREGRFAAVAAAVSPRRLGRRRVRPQRRRLAGPATTAAPTAAATPTRRATPPTSERASFVPYPYFL